MLKFSQIHIVILWRVPKVYQDDYYFSKQQRDIYKQAVF